MCNLLYLYDTVRRRTSHPCCTLAQRLAFPAVCWSALRYVAPQGSVSKLNRKTTYDSNDIFTVRTVVRPSVRPCVRPVSVS